MLSSTYRSVSCMCSAVRSTCVPTMSGNTRSTSPSAGSAAATGTSARLTPVAPASPAPVAPVLRRTPAPPCARCHVGDAASAGGVGVCGAMSCAAIAVLLRECFIRPAPGRTTVPDGLDERTTGGTGGAGADGALVAADAAAPAALAPALPVRRLTPSMAPTPDDDDVGDVAVAGPRGDWYGTSSSSTGVAAGAGPDGTR